MRYDMGIMKRIGHGVAAVRLGDIVSGALAKAGITPERVTAFLGRECGCKDRREKMNRMMEWAGRVLAGEAEDANEELDRIISGKKADEEKK